MYWPALALRGAHGCGVHAFASVALGALPYQFGVDVQRGRPLGAPASVSFYVQYYKLITSVNYYGCNKTIREGEGAGAPQEVAGALPRRTEGGAWGRRP